MVTPYNDGLALTVQRLTNVGTQFVSGTDYSLSSSFELYPDIISILKSASRKRDLSE